MGLLGLMGLLAGCAIGPTQPAVNLKNTVWKTSSLPNGNAPIPPKPHVLATAENPLPSGGAADADIVLPPTNALPATNVVLSWNAVGQQEYFIYYTTNAGWCMGLPTVNNLPMPTRYGFPHWTYLAAYYSASNRVAQVNIAMPSNNPAAFFKVQ